METKVNDLLLIYHGPTPLGYGRVEDITADVKPGWWHLSLLLLKLPPQYVTWILREEYIDGDTFTMGGEKMRLQRMPRVGAPHLVPPLEEDKTAEQQSDESGVARGKVIQLKPRQPKIPTNDDIV